MPDAHDLRHNREPCLCLGFFQELQALGLQALEGIGRGSGLERAAAQEGCAGGLYALGHFADLGLCLNGARAGDQGEVAVADLLAGGQGDDGVVRVELPVCLLVGFLHALDALYKVLCGDIVDIDGSGVAKQAEHRALRADPGVDLDVVFLCEAVRKFLDLLLRTIWLQNNNHADTLQFFHVRFVENKIGGAARCSSAYEKNSQVILQYRGVGYSYSGSCHRKDCMRKNPTPKRSGDSQNL